MRINVGCGKNTTKGWRNFDNSLSLWFAKLGFLSKILFKLKIFDQSEYQYIQFCRSHGIEYGDVVKGLSIQPGSVDVLYSSHMIEHLDLIEVEQFLENAKKILRSGGGIIRLVVPDLRKFVQRYLETGDADAFVKETLLGQTKPRTILQKIRALFVGPQGHCWAYDGKSLCELLMRHGFVNVQILSPGETRIKDPGELDLRERESQSVFVEAEKP